MISIASDGVSQLNFTGLAIGAMNVQLAAQGFSLFDNELTGADRVFPNPPYTLCLAVTQARMVGHVPKSAYSKAP